MFKLLSNFTVDCRLESQLVQTKDYKIAIWCFSANHATLSSKTKAGWE